MEINKMEEKNKQVCSLCGKEVVPTIDNEIPGTLSQEKAETGVLDIVGQLQLLLQLV